MDEPKRVLIGITGASGVIYGIRILELLAEAAEIETQLIISPPGERTLREETDYDLDQVHALADRVYGYQDIGAPPASGSYPAEGMIIAPCSMKTLSAVSLSCSDNLLVRAADVQLKEGRPLLLVVRETPLHAGHLKRMLEAAENGAVIMPPVPSWYSQPDSLETLVDQTARRILARFGISLPGTYQWPGSQQS